MKVQNPISHWGNFTVPTLKEILEHCVALDRLGIAQDEEMMRSIERDISLREKENKPRPQYQSKPKRIRQIINQNRSRTNKIAKKTAQHEGEQPQEYLLQETV